MSDTVILIEAEWQLRELVSGQEIRFGDPAKVGYAGELGDKNVLKLKPGVERTCEARLTAAEALKMVDVLDAERSGTSIVVRGGDVQITGQFQVEQDGVGYLLKGRVKEVAQNCPPLPKLMANADIGYVHYTNGRTFIVVDADDFAELAAAAAEEE